jgi:hypothetical protein
MHTVLTAELVRARSEELRRQAASARKAGAAAGARHPRRPRIRRRFDLAARRGLSLWTRGRNGSVTSQP